MRLSKSKISTHDRCPLRFRWEYMDKVRLPEPPEIDDEQMIGRLTHAALERIYAWAARERYVGPLCTATILARAHATVLDQATKGETAVGRDHPLVGQALDMVIDYLSDADVDGHDVLGTEQLVVLNLDGTQAVGYLDRAERFNENTLVVIDYKTGRRLPDQAEIKMSLEARLYVVAARQQWGWAQRVVFRIDGLRHREKRSVGYSAAEVKLLRASLTGELAEAKQRLLAPPWPANEGPWCSHCPFFTMCPAKDGEPPAGAYVPDPVRGAKPGVTVWQPA